MDIDTVVIDANYTLPFEAFAAKSKDLVVYGNRSEVERGHPVKGSLPSHAFPKAPPGRVMEPEDDAFFLQMAF